MNRKMNIYYMAFVGGLAGLISWLVLSVVPGLETLSPWLRSLLKGCIIGLLIGGSLGVVEGLLDRSRQKSISGAVAGLVAGAIGGGLGLTAGEFALSFIEGGLLGRAVGWMLLGLAVGIASGIAYRSKMKVLYGIIGGSVGGLIGGLVLEYFTQLRVQVSQPWLTGVGLVVLGLCIGVLIAVVEEVFVRAKFKVLTGMLEGREFNITKQVTVLGSDERCDICLPRDREIAHRQVQIVNKGRQYELMVFPESRVLINNQTFPGSPGAGSIKLNDRDRIKLGKTTLLFSEARVKKQ